MTVDANIKLIIADLNIKAKLYHKAINKSIKSGKYNPGTIISLINSGSTNRIIAATPPHNNVKLSILGIHFIM